MADVVLTRQQIDRDGLDVSFAGVDNVDTYYAPNDGRTVLHFKNTGGSASTVTLDLTKTVAGAALADQTITVPATTGDREFGPFPLEWNDDAGPNPGHLKFTQDQATGVTVAVKRV